VALTLNLTTLYSSSVDVHQPEVQVDIRYTVAVVYISIGACFALSDIRYVVNVVGELHAARGKKEKKSGIQTDQGLGVSFFRVSAIRRGARSEIGGEIETLAFHSGPSA
jgi:hypothetical protein